MKNILFLFVGLISFASFSQENENANVIDFKIESDNIAELSEFNWGSLKEVIALDNDEQFVVSLVYNNTDLSRPSRIDNFTLNYALTEDNFSSMLIKIKSQLESLKSLDKKV